MPLLATRGVAALNPRLIACTPWRGAQTEGIPVTSTPFRAQILPRFHLPATDPTLPRQSTSDDTRTRYR